jgi:opacity protein-like surface antigen/outer membrane protease
MQCIRSVTSARILAGTHAAYLAGNRVNATIAYNDGFSAGAPSVVAHLGVNMKSLLRAGIVLAAMASAGQVSAADMPVKAVPPIAVYNWTGFYVGVHVGAGLGFSEFSDPYGASIFGDTVRTPAFLLGAQAGYNWQAPGSNWVWGVEGDLSWLLAEGTNTCFTGFAPVPGFGIGMITSSNCRARPDLTGTLIARLGLATGSGGRTLLYLKGGAAFLHNRLDATTNFGFGVFPITATSNEPTSWGWTIGAGIEQAVAPAWSVKLEYDYLNFADASFTSPGTFTTTPGIVGFFVPVAGAPVTVRQDMHQVKIGLNYHFNNNGPWASSSYAAYAAAPPAMGGWAFEFGGRYWYSSGRFQKDLPAGNVSSLNLVSRLTYDDLTAHSGELFGRIDSPFNVFLKGFVGGGRITNGHMNDEDWGLFAGVVTAYSNTISNLSATNMNYATVDLGFDFMKGPAYKVGAFVGWNHIYEQYAATDCNQIATPASGICSPMISGVPVITETDKWDSLRLGLATEFWPWPQVKVAGDLAFLPYVKFTGTDNHWLRALVIDETGRGYGVQTEAIVSYYVTPAFSVGLGGRYWAMWTTSGNDAFNGVPIDRNDTYRYERWGAFLQAAYRFQ